MTNDQSVDDGAARIETQFGRLDILVNNAAVLGSMNSQGDRESFRDVLNVNVVGSSSVTDAFLGLLRKSTERRLVFVSSSTGSITHASDPASPYYSPYALRYRTSKAALNMLMVMYNVILKDEGFKVFGADPGLCATNLSGDPDSLRRRNAAEPGDGGLRVSTVVKGEKDEHAGRVLGVYGVSPF